MTTHVDYSQMTSKFLAWCDECGEQVFNIQGSAEALAWKQNHECTPKEPT